MCDDLTPSGRIPVRGVPTKKSPRGQVFCQGADFDNNLQIITYFIIKIGVIVFVNDLEIKKI